MISHLNKLPCFVIDVNSLTWELRSLQILDFSEKESFGHFFSLAVVGCAFSETCSLWIQRALLKSMGFGVIWTSAQMLVTALISCVISNKFHDLC